MGRAIAKCILRGTVRRPMGVLFTGWLVRGGGWGEEAGGIGMLSSDLFGHQVALEPSLLAAAYLGQGEFQKLRFCRKG